MNQEELCKYGTRLQALLKELQQEEEGTKEDRAPIAVDGRMGRISRADALQDQHMALAMGRRRQERILRINSALDRIEDGSFGLCGRCERPVSEARLETMPEVILCVKCAEKQKSAAAYRHLPVTLLCAALIAACSTNKSETETKEEIVKELTSGDIAPAFQLKDQDGSSVSLADFKGRKLLIYFYPKASTPGCTAQACSIRDAAEDFSRLNVPVLGISPDGPSAQAKFHQKYNLGFPLLCDEDLAAANAYGVYKKRLVGDSLIPGIRRSSFLIDEEGRILKAWYGISPADTVPAALEALK